MPSKSLHCMTSGAPDCCAPLFPASPASIRSDSRPSAALELDFPCKPLALARLQMDFVTASKEEMTCNVDLAGHKHSVGSTEPVSC